ncbi:hypothetical protein [Providencia huashanensis]|uniref:hypothetical protein n=1 Tax=Providencia huashanensis TaxID=3037798 RepID=UPI002ACC6C0D|nr:hypothetical protein [Providencia rettgeri]
MLRHFHSNQRPTVKLTMPDGSVGFITTSDRCYVVYDLPQNIKIEPVKEHQPKGEAS